MVIALAIAAILLLLTVRLYHQAYERPPNFPPGPPRLPIWGSYWLLLLENYRFMHKATLSLAQRYKTPVLGVFLGPIPTVVVTKYELVREVLARTEFAARPDLVQVRMRAFGQRLGIFFSDGQSWMEQKRFMLRNMRDFGFGRRYKSMEEALREEAEDLVALGRGEWTDEVSMRDGCMSFPTALYPGLLNVLWTMISGQRFSKDQYGTLRTWAAAGYRFVRNVDQLGGAVAQTPWLLKLAGEATGVPAVVRSTHEIADVFKQILHEHEESYSEDLLHDFIDRYIHKMRKEGPKKEFSFTEEQLQIVGADLLLAAGSTTSSTLTFALRALLHHPEVQRRCQEELDAVVGSGRLPTLDDRPNLPYTEATIRETMRRITLLPMLLPHMTAEDTKLGGYDLPKNTVVICNAHAVHNDREIWGDPENFRPDRFLNEQGRLKKDITVPFGAGKRLCPGETFSRQTMFVLFAALLQNFRLEAAGPEQLPPLDHVVNGLSLTPGPDLWVRVTPRY